MRQQQLLQMQQQQQQQQYLAAQQQLVPQQTSFGSNNPFASFSNAPPLPSQPSPVPPASSLSTFSLPSTYETHSPHTNLSSSLSPAPISSASSSPGPSRPTRADQEHAHLANLFAAPRDDGLDTFGNIGQLRCVVHSCFVRFFGCYRGGSFWCLSMATIPVTRGTRLPFDRLRHSPAPASCSHQYGPRLSFSRARD